MISLSLLRKRLALPRTSWQLCLLAAIGGAASALLVVLFTISIDTIQSFYLIQKDNYTSLDALSRFVLPIVGGLMILFFAWLTGYQYLRTGIPFILHRLKVANGIIPFRNTINQFFGSVVALASGFSVGKEGPAIHLGAACSSYIGNKLNLPFNTIRTLCACGIAAGIAACFNTPIAAVIFVMEVILREYKVHIFIPVMIAALIGSMITRSILGSAHEFAYFDKISLSFHHYPALVLLGLILGLLAYGFNRYLILIIKYSSSIHIVPRILLAAFITGTLGFFVPFAMGTDLGAITFALENNLHIQLLLGLLFAKILMTITALGLGIPGGIIGPIIGIGAIAGTCVSVLVTGYLPGENLAGDYALMGMAGFLAATLNAPLAALLTVVELSNQLEVVVPAMIVITTACVFSGQFFKNRSVFVMQLEQQGLKYRKSPIEKSLQRIGVLGVLQENINVYQQECSKDVLRALEKVELLNHVIIQASPAIENLTPYSTFTWLKIEHNPAVRAVKIVPLRLIPLQSQSTLAEAYLALIEQRDGGVYVYDEDLNDILGIITFEQIRSYLLEGKTTV
ncbi:chloride channel protein [Colwellia sp. MB3u-28]|nr:chloride channel protein [Colwellia sp. MB02u-7]MBA6237174.1 chloride channel protein [Colwellia sp. MB02u-11]MBA6257394.1 chloride channel protein [Colwellia sp. MB3u-28]MBA6260466.1 chloride channel protein [Colwellia sp. MB3u-41]MBA6301562.1 chloride channel protein [Colwellia sp. MB3u-22]MBA6311448.1 chloride channel protein [Colwellia sp. MB3u-64]